MYLNVIIFSLWGTFTIYLVLNFFKYKYLLRRSLSDLYESNDILDFLINNQKVRVFLLEEKLIEIKERKGNTIVIEWMLNRKTHN